MSILALVARRYLPAFIKKRELRRLRDLTARALGRAAPSFSGRSYAECLAEYARFTAGELARARERGEDLRIAQGRLYEGGYRLGARYRRWFRVATTGQAMEVAKLLYAALGIHLEGTQSGVTVTSCAFSRCYSPETCRVVSSLDAGFMAGLSAGGELTFTQRMTEGFDRCQASFVPAQASQ